MVLPCSYVNCRWHPFVFIAAERRRAAALRERSEAERRRAAARDALGHVAVAMSAVDFHNTAVADAEDMSGIYLDGVMGDSTPHHSNGTFVQPSHSNRIVNVDLV